MLSADQLKLFSTFIEQELGIVYSETNSFQLQNRLQEIANQLFNGDIKQLWSQSQAGIEGQFRQLLLDVATNNETSFFRDKKVFLAVEKLAENWNQTRPLTVWSAASSFGQEAYTMAIVFEELKQKKQSFTYKIMGTDIADRAVTRAREAKYTSLEVQRGLPAGLMIKYFDASGSEHWAAKPQLRKHVSFDKLNLLHEFSRLPKFDLILCRNVLIYQSIPNKKQVIARLAQQLNPQGHLILGAGESMMGLSDRFSQVPLEGAVIYQLSTETRRAAA